MDISEKLHWTQIQYRVWIKKQILCVPFGVQWISQFYSNNHLFVISLLHLIMITAEAKKNNAWVTMNNDFWVIRDAICQWFFTSYENRDFVTRENYCQVASRVTQKALFTVTKLLFYFFTCYPMSWTYNSAKTIIYRSFLFCRQGRSFLT